MNANYPFIVAKEGRTAKVFTFTCDPAFIEKQICVKHYHDRIIKWAYFRKLNSALQI